MRFLSAAATTLTWLLWTLAKNPEVQEKLREELQEAGTWDSDEEDISLDRLNSLPFLEAVCVSHDFWCFFQKVSNCVN